MDFVSDINISGGGPIIARKLRIFTSFRDWRVHVNVPAAFSTLVLDKTDITSGLVNANYQFERQPPPYRPLLASVLQEAESVPDRTSNAPSLGIDQQ